MNYGLLACSSAFLSLAMLTPVEAAPPEGGGDRKAELVKKFDKDGDGQLSESERSAMQQALSKLRDAAGGKPGAGKPGTGGPPFDKAAMMKKLDKDGDGQLSDSEKQAGREALEKLRAGAGGKPGAGKPGSGRPGLGGKPGAGKPGEAMRAELLKKFDKDGDGQLNDSEKKAAMEARGGKPGAKRPEKN